MPRALVGLALEDEVQLPVPPLGGPQFALDVEEKAFAGRMRLGTGPPGQLVDAVDGPVIGQHGAGSSHEGGVKVGDVHDVVADGVAGHAAGPAHDQRHAQAAFHGRVVRARPGPGGATPGPAELGAVVAGKDEQRLVVDAERRHRVQQLPDAVVHLDHRIGEVADTAAAHEVRVRQCRKVQVRERHVQQEGLLAGRVPAHEVHGTFGQFAVDQAALGEVVFGDIARGLAGKPFHHLRHVHHRGVETGRAREHRLVAGARDAVPLVEAALVRVAPVAVAQVPFAEHAGGITGLLQYLWQRAFPGMDALRKARRHRLQRAGS